MGAPAMASTTRRTRKQPESLTLLELVRAVSECTEDDREVAATIRHMLVTGRVRLRGCFRDEPLRSFLS